MEKKELITLLQQKGFNEKIIKAFSEVERADFVPAEYQKYAYVNGPLPLGDGATISQPQTIAHMLEWLELTDNQKVLEIGSGSGYALALMNNIAPNATFIGIELNAILAEKSKLVLPASIKILNQNGLLGLPESAPFDRILASAAFDEKPDHLIEQLCENGVLVAPIKDHIYRFEKTAEGVKETAFYGFSFVPMKKENK